MRAAHRQERRRQDHAASAPSPGCSIPRKGRCSGAARRRAPQRDEFHSELAYLGHEPPLKGDLSARENLKYSIGIRRAVTPAEIDAALRAPARARSPIGATRMLSAGQKRRVALAGVLLANAVLWLLDEPTTNLDADGQQLVRDLISEQLARDGIVVAAVHHSLALPAEQSWPLSSANRDWQAMKATPLAAARLVAMRDLRLAFRKPSQVIQPLMFFMIVATLFPLTLTPEMSRLRDAAPGVLWIGALLSSLLALEFLFRDDAVDGTLEQFALSGQSLTWMLFAKTCTHWMLTGLPLALSAPIAAAALGVSLEAMGGVVASLALGSFAMSLVGAIGAGLTLGARRGGVLLSLLTLPLAVPILIFGARATQLAISGGDIAPPMYLLGAIAVLGVTLAPLAAAAAVRIGLE